MSTIQDILYAKMLADQEAQEAKVAGGLAGGAVLGTAAGAYLAPTKSMYGVDKNARLSVRGSNLGRRFAGGLVGAIVGGGLGRGVQQMAVKESPAAAVLARIQAQGGMTLRDQVEIQKLLEEFYKQGGM